MKRDLLLLASTAAALSSMTPLSAHAGLLDAGSTVQATYVSGSFSNVEAELPVGGSNTDPASLASSVGFQQGADDGSTISVGDTQIIITNLLTPGTGKAYCLSGVAGTACTDAIDGFDFLFTGENILGVTVDPATTAGFLPVSGTFQGSTHNGLQLISNNEILVDVTGDDPPTGAQLVLDITTGSSSPTPTPEPTSLALFGSAVIGIGAAARRRWLR
jgi:hypothetical protein